MFLEANISWADIEQYQDIIEHNKSYIKIESKNYNLPRIFSFQGDILEKIIKFLLLPKTKKSFQKLGNPF